MKRTSSDAHNRFLTYWKRFHKLRLHKSLRNYKKRSKQNTPLDKYVLGEGTKKDFLNNSKRFHEQMKKTSVLFRNPADYAYFCNAWDNEEGDSTFWHEMKHYAYYVKKGVPAVLGICKVRRGKSFDCVFFCLPLWYKAKHMKPLWIASVNHYATTAPGRDMGEHDRIDAKASRKIYRLAMKRFDKEHDKILSEEGKRAAKRFAKRVGLCKQYKNGIFGAQSPK